MVIMAEVGFEPTPPRHWNLESQLAKEHPVK